MTCAAIDQGHKPAVVTAIMKSQATDRMRVSVNDAMDVHGGKGIMEGPLNYLGSLYRGIPIGITVEGANIVTRSSHSIRPGRHSQSSLSAEGDDGAARRRRKRGLDAFDQSFWGHVGHGFANTMRAWTRAWTDGMFAPAPDVGAPARFYRRLGRLYLGLCAGRRSRASEPRRRAQTAGDVVGALRRRLVGTVSFIGCAQALARRRLPAGRFPAA